MFPSPFLLAALGCTHPAVGGPQQQNGHWPGQEGEGGVVRLILKVREEYFDFVFEIVRYWLRGGSQEAWLIGFAGAGTATRKESPNRLRGKRRAPESSVERLLKIAPR
jgi:hypothetical protein